MTPRHLKDFRYILECVFVSVCVFIRVCCVTSSTWAVEWKFCVQGQHNDSGHSCKCVQCDATSTSPPLPDPQSSPAPGPLLVLCPQKTQKTLDILFILLRPHTHQDTHSPICPGRQGRPLELHTYIYKQSESTDRFERAGAFFSILYCLLFPKPVGVQL